MQNERGAGRKKILTDESIAYIIERISAGDTVVELANEYGVSRQALYKRIKAYNNSKSVLLSYFVGGEESTRIEIDIVHEQIHIQNMGERISTYAFGLNKNPSWEEFGEFLEEQFLTHLKKSPQAYICNDYARNSFSLDEVVEKVDALVLAENEDEENITSVVENENIQLPPLRFTFTKKDILYARTDTDGFQLKALSNNRKWFVKSQAIMGDTIMNDWAVEILATNICNQLKIACVKQHYCEIEYAGRLFKAVSSLNFELDGYIFESFESILEKNGKSTNDREFIHLGTIEKLEWCAQKLSQYGKIPYELTHQYMIDLAIVDCLVGNVDRHTRNFGLFFNTLELRYKIPLIFDNGMGLFEHDYYRDRYTDYSAAMRNVYVSPYGEDPFDMLDILNEQYDLLALYPNLSKVDYMEEPLIWNALNDNARCYATQMKEKLRTLCD